MRIKAEFSAPRLERSGLNDSEGLVGASGFDPKQLILRAKRRRNFSERFDSFSDAYVWVLAALVALAYLFSAIFGLIFALLGQGVAHPKMPTAVWSLQELSPILLVLAAIWLLRLLLHLGPVAVNAATADWWLPLPLSSASLRARALRKALLFGMLASAFAGVLWLIVLYGLTGAFDPLLAGCALACFVLAGLLLANAGVIVQSFGLQSPAQRWLGRSVMAIIAVLAVSWGLLAAENQWTMSAVQGVAASILQLRTWTYASAILLPLGIIGTWWAMQRNRHIGSRSLRSSGEKQQLALGTLMQADGRAATGPSAVAIGRRRRHGTLIAARLPVIWRILALRLMRAGYWRTTAGYLLLVMALAAAVDQVANPLSAVVFYAALGVLLALNLSGVIAPLLTQPQLTQHLGQSAARLSQTAALFAVLYSAVALSALTGGLGLLGIVDLSRFWLWCDALVIGALGSAAASLGHAQRKERDWESLLGSATSEATIGFVLFSELSTLVRAMATFAPMFSLALSPSTEIAWPLWVVSSVFTVPALRLLVGEFPRRSRG